MSKGPVKAAHGKKVAADAGEAKPKAMSIEELILAMPSSQPDTVVSLNLAKKAILSLPSQLAFLKALRRVDLSHNALVDLTPLAKLSTLTQLKLSNNKIRDLKPLAPLGGLVVLDVGHNELTSLQGIERMRSLKAIIAPDNQLTSLEAFEQLAAAGACPDTVVVSRNPLSTPEAIAPVAHFASTLRKLSASQCGLSQLPVLDMPLLNELRLSGNSIAEFGEGSAFRSLKILDMANNRLETFASITKFSVFVDQLSVHGNPVAETADDGEKRLLRRMIARIFKNVALVDGAKFDRKEALQSRRGVMDDPDAGSDDGAAEGGAAAERAVDPAVEVADKDVVFESELPAAPVPSQRVYVRARKTHRTEPRTEAGAGGAETDPSFQRGPRGAPLRGKQRSEKPVPPAAPTPPTKEVVLKSLAAHDPLGAGGW